MDTPDRREHDADAQPEPASYLPPAPLPGPAPVPQPAWEMPADSASAEPEMPTARPFSPKVILHALRRHWWQILLLWAAASAAAVTLVYYKVKPSFEATALLKVEPVSRQITSVQTITASDFERFLQTQVHLISSPDVLSAALHNPKVSALPRFVLSLDAEMDLRQMLRVVVVPDTHVIQVSTQTQDPAEGPLIVNAVVDAYYDAARRWIDEDMQAQVSRLGQLKTKLVKEIRDRESSLLDLQKQLGKQAIIRSADTASPEEFATFRANLASVQIERIAAETDVDSLTREVARLSAGAPAEAAKAPNQVEAAVQKLFQADPAVAALVAQIGEAEEQLQQTKRLMRQHNNDPYTRRLNDNLKRLRDDYQDRWADMYPALRQQVLQEQPQEPSHVATRRAALQQAEATLNRLTAQEKMLQEQISKLQIQSQEAGDLTTQIKFAEEARSQARTTLATVDNHLNQIEYERLGNTTINVVARARETGKPTDNNRLKMMVAAPVGILALVLGLFTLAEIGAARVADPEDIPSRVRLGVLGVVPPLPALSGPGRGGLRRRDDRRRVEEFVQSLDHLRVTLYAGRPDGTRRRTVLITSAVGGEGKTTLAAQLAGRCANAGLLTVLVDADLRRPSLGDLLEVPEGPGLAEVLAGDVPPESAMVVIGNAGGFHLLPAGSAGHDPSRLLHGERLGQLLAQLKATFDVVIVDAPPVLAVPDALLLGRWTDGAVLAVRHDASRFPLVERAHRRLAAVGIPVLGAVVNGCRTMETNYGAYQYNPYVGRGADPNGA